MKRIALSVAAAAVAFLSEAGITGYQWQKDSAGNWSGSITNAEHWKGGVVPNNNARAWFDHGSYADMEISFPEGVYTNFMAFYPAVYGGKTMTVDGRNTVWMHPQNAEGEYHSTPFAIYQNTSVRDFIQLSLSGATPNPTTSPNLVFSNFLFAATLSGDSRSAKLDFKQGLYEFLHPCGHSWDWNIQKPALSFFSLNNNDATANKNLMDSIEITFSNSTLNAQDIALRGNATSNVLTIVGGRHVIATVDMPGRYDGSALRHDRTVTDFILDGAEVISTNRFNICNDQWATSRVNRVYLRNHAKLLVPTMYCAYGETELNVDDSEVTFGLDGAHDQKCNYSASKSVAFTFTNRARAIFDHLGANESANGTGFFFGVDGATESKHTLVFDNSEVILKSGSKLTGYTADMIFRNGTVIDNRGSIYPKGGSAARPLEMVFDGIVITNNGAFCLSSGTGSTHLVITNGTKFVTCRDTLFAGTELAAIGDGCQVTVDMHSGEIVVKTGGYLEIGEAANATATFNLYGGSITQETTTASFNVGEGGTGFFNMYGGRVYAYLPRVAGNYKVGYDYGDAPESVFTQEGGEFIVGSIGNGWYKSFVVGNESEGDSRRGKIVLNGGVLESYSIAGGLSAACRGGRGWAKFAANGGTVRLPGGSPCTILAFDEAKLGAKGLTIDSNGYAATVLQHVWSDADGESGALIFTGDGTKCPTGNVERLSNIVLAGGTTDLSMIDGSAVNNLIVTNGATLKLDPAKTLTVRGTLTLGEASLALTANGTVGETYDILRFAAEPSADVKLALAEIKYPGGIAGLGNDRTCDIDVVSDGDGAFVARMTVRAPQAVRIELPEGISNATEDIRFDLMDRLEADVGLSGALTLAGLYRYGVLKMVGEGSVEISDWAKVQTSDFLVKRGVLTVSGPAEGLEIGRQIVLAHESTNDIFVINNAVDVRMPVPYGNNQDGEFVKRGPGTLVWEVEGQKNFLGGYGKAKISNNMWSWEVGSVGQLTFDTVSGMVTTSGVPPLTVAEGKLVLKGKGENPTFKINGSAVVGTSTKVGEVQPGLVLDGVTVDQTKYPSRKLNVGCAINYTISGSSSSRSGDFAIEPYVILTNGATYVNDTFELARFCMGKDVKVRVELDDSTISSTYFFVLNRAQNEDPSTFVAARNGSKILTPWLATGYPSVMEFDNSELAKDDAGNGLSIKPENSPSASVQLDARFRNRSVLRTVSIDPSTLVPGGWRKPYTLLFDDSDWYPIDGVADATLEWAKPEQLYIVTTNRGLHFPVPATATWTVRQPVNGTGDLVNSGKGTLVLGETALAYTGATIASDADGVVDFGGYAQTTSLGGAGTFRNGTIVGGITLRDGLVPTIASDLVLSDRVDVRVLDDTPLAPGASLAVLNFQGMAPDVTRFKLVNTSATSGLKGVFTIDGSRVVCTTVQQPGLMLILR